MALANLLAHPAKNPCKSHVLHWSRKPLEVQASRGFKSHPLRYNHAGFRVQPFTDAGTDGLGNRCAQSTEVHWDPGPSVAFRADWRTIGERHQALRAPSCCLSRQGARGMENACRECSSIRLAAPKTLLELLERSCRVREGGHPGWPPAGTVCCRVPRSGRLSRPRSRAAVGIDKVTVVAEAANQPRPRHRRQLR